MKESVALVPVREERGRNDLRPAVTQILELHSADDDIPGHAVPFECLDYAILWSHLTKPPLESVGLAVMMLDKTPVTTALDLQLLYHELVAATPPLGDQLRFRVSIPHAITRSLERALDADLSLSGRGDCRSLCRGGHGYSPFVRSRNSPSLSSRSSSIFWYLPIQAASSARRRGPSVHVLTRPIFSDLTR